MNFVHEMYDDKLREITELEKKLLHGEVGEEEIQEEFFSQSIGGNFIDYNKYLNGKSMITVEKHLRFVEFPTHSHNYIEMIYVYSGSLKNVLSDVELDIKPGQMLMLNQYANHAIKLSGENDIAINIIVNPDFFKSIIGPTTKTGSSKIFKFLYNNTFSNKKFASNYLIFDLDGLPSVFNIIGKIIEDYYNTSEISDYAMRLCLNLLILEMIRYDERIQVGHAIGDKDTFFIEVYEYLSTQFQKASLDELSSKLNLSKSHLSRKIKNIFGDNFSNLLNGIRISKSELYLRTTEYSIEEICNMVGYSNSTYFYKQFKNKNTITPREFRKRIDNV